MSDAGQDQLFSDPIGARLKAARTAKRMSLEDVAKQTRVPTRHLIHIEGGEWDALPAVTYSVGFTRAYANAVGLDGNAIATELRQQLGGGAPYAAPEVSFYEPADPARVPPRFLAIVAGLIALAILVGYAVWRSGRLDGTETDPNVAAGLPAEGDVAQQAPAPAPAVAPAPSPAPAAVPPIPATGSVVLTATDTVWLRVYEAGGGPKLVEKELKAGESYTVPATAKRPEILTGRPDVLRVTVGGRAIPPLGPPKKTIADRSLLPADLVRTPTP